MDLTANKRRGSVTLGTKPWSQSSPLRPCRPTFSAPHRGPHAPVAAQANGCASGVRDPPSTARTAAGAGPGSAQDPRRFRVVVGDHGGSSTSCSQRRAAGWPPTCHSLASETIVSVVDLGLTWPDSALGLDPAPALAKALTPPSPRLDPAPTQP